MLKRWKFLPSIKARASSTNCTMGNLTCSRHATYLHTIYVKSPEIHILLLYKSLNRHKLFCHESHFDNHFHRMFFWHRNHKESKINVRITKDEYSRWCNTVVSNHFHSIKILLFLSARSRDFDGMLSAELPVSMYTTKTPIDMCRFNVRSST